MASEVEIAAVRRAVALASGALGRTYPNPVVGCVLLDQAGDEIAAGRHEGPGTPHAEVAALAAAGERARGATAVVTLEPCRHHGRTGPCTDALVAAGVARVVYAVDDPVPDHGGGAAVLRERGVDVEGGVLRDEAARGNEAWLHAVTSGRPFVTWKYAASLDGRVAAADGTSRWVTGEQARADVHRMRGECDAIAVGVSTVLADDPHLTVRTPDGALAARQSLRVVVDSTLRVPLSAKVLDGAAPTLVATTERSDPARRDALREKVTVAVLPESADGHTDVRAVLRALRDREVVHLLVEGGPKLAGTLVGERLVDRVVGYVAPAVLGGGGRPMLDNAGAATIAEAQRLRLDDVTRFGADVRLTFRPFRAGGA